jgi:predicted acylesterase/phospholipase RssA
MKKKRKDKIYSMYILSFILLMASVLSTKMPLIKHLVISGGGAAGFSYYGVLKQTQIKGLWQPENIKTIYATSAGTLLAVIVALGYDWKTLDDYLIKRPWDKVYKFELSMVIKAILNQGIFDIHMMQDTFNPLFKGKDIPIDINLLDFYKYTNKEIHFFTTNFHTFETVDISYKTHPEWKVIDAIYASSCLPVMFVPLYKKCEEKEKEDEIYIDGGIKMNYPLNKCIDDGNIPEEIFGINRIDLNMKKDKKLFRSDNLFDFICKIIYKYALKIEIPLYPVPISHEISVAFSAIDFSALFRCVSNEEERKTLIEKGMQVADEYLDKFKTKED